MDTLLPLPTTASPVWAGDQRVPQRGTALKKVGLGGVLGCGLLSCRLLGGLGMMGKWRRLAHVSGLRDSHLRSGWMRIRLPPERGGTNLSITTLCVFDARWAVKLSAISADVIIDNERFNQSDQDRVMAHTGKNRH